MKIVLKPLCVLALGATTPYNLYLRMGDETSSVAVCEDIAVWEEDLVLPEAKTSSIELWHFDLSQGHQLLATHRLDLFEEDKDHLLAFEQVLLPGLQFWLRLRWQRKSGRPEGEQWHQFFNEQRRVVRKRGTE